MSSSHPGRNTPCPCGSARKYKRCCALATHAASVRLRDARRELDLGLALSRRDRLEEAVARFARAIALDPTLAQAHFSLGAALLDLGREAEALGALQTAASLTPHVPAIQRMLAGLLLDWGRPELATAAFRAAAAAAVAASPVQAVCDGAWALRTEGRLEEAKAALLRARAVDPDDLLVAKMLGHIYSEQGRFSEADQELRSVLARDPRDANAAHALFQVAKARESDRPLLAELAAHASRSERTSPERMMLGFALGRAYDQLGDYAEAMRHFEAANAIRSAIAPLDRMTLVRDIEQAIATFPRGSLEPAEAEPNDSGERALFVVGLPRSGTTLLEQILSSHSRVTAGGELAFWSVPGPGAAVAGAERAVLAPLAAAYLSLLDGIDPAAARIVDKNPFNFLRLGLLRRALPLARIVHVRRTPIDTALSLFTTCFSARNNFFFGSREDLLFYYDHYVRLMNHWRVVLPAERFLEVDYEALVDDREAQTRRLIAFCGLDWEDACMHPERNERVVSTASLWQVRQPVHRGAVGRWRNYAPWLGSLLRLAPEEPKSQGPSVP